MSVDLLSETWRTVEVHAKKGIELATAQTMTRGVQPMDTEFERGRIAALKEILRLGDTPASTPNLPKAAPYA